MTLSVGRVAVRPGTGDLGDAGHAEFDGGVASLDRVV
jgi:hypothetical protein